MISDIGRRDDASHDGLSLPKLLESTGLRPTPFIFYVGDSQHSETPDGKSPVVTTVRKLFDQINLSLSRNS